MSLNEMPPPNEMSPALLAHIGEIMKELPGGMTAPRLPAHAPREGQSREDWHAELAALRADADRLAEIMVVHMTARGPEVGSVSDVSIPLRDGTMITARVYRPAGTGPFPGVVFFHGGAWWLAGGEPGFALTDDYCRIMCGRLNSVIVNVDYRLAPEHPYPGQLHDAYDATVWTAGNTASLDIDPANVSVMGASSGGNLAAAVALLARDSGGPRLVTQILHVAALDLTAGSPSHYINPGEREAMVLPVYRLYATEEQQTEPYVSPLLAPDLAGLPPAVIVTGEFDVLRDDGRRYAARLAEHGVPVRLLDYPMLHNIALPETSERMFTEMGEAITAFQAEYGA